jgi:hypothetical protein
MRKLIYISTAIVFILSASSCTKQCVQCQATDKRGVTINVSNKVCEHDFNSGKFQDRYKEQFKDYSVSCGNVN